MLTTIKLHSDGTLTRVAQCLLTYDPADGVFDERFEEFVKEWQTAHFLTVDGVIGADTWKAICEGLPLVSTSKFRYSTYAMAIQLLLGIDADGIFGKKTKAAVVAYQAAAGLKADSIVGHDTWNMLLLGEVSTDTKTDFVQPPNFKQYDKRWATKMYSNHGDKAQTMKSSACGPTSMADIVALWWDSTITPYDLAVKSMDWGTRTYNSGTSSTFFRKCAELYKASKYVTTSNIDTAIKCLQTGGYVVVCFGKSKWTSGGHYCCLWKYKDGKFGVNDPASAKESRASGTYDEVKKARKGFYCFWK